MERKGIGEIKFRQQLEKIFKHKELLSRVKLVIFSGLDHGVYKFFKDEFVNYRDKNGFDFVINDKVPFFYPTNFLKIKEATSENQLIFKEVYDEFIKLPKTQ
jgi:hypothetical protein